MSTWDNIFAPCPPRRFQVICSSCRCESLITVKPYPTGPDTPKLCPVCGATGDSIEVGEVLTAWDIQQAVEAALRPPATEEVS